MQALVAYLFGCQLKDRSTGLIAAALMALVPGTHTHTHTYTHTLLTPQQVISNSCTLRCLNRVAATKQECAYKGALCVCVCVCVSAPGYMSRSVAGSFDNEAVAIFALILTFYLWTRAVEQGTVAAGVMCAFAYLYMASSW